MKYTKTTITNFSALNNITERIKQALLRLAIGFEGALEFDASKPDGTPRKIADVSRLRDLGWVAKTGLSDGLKTTYDWYLGQSSVKGQ